METRKTIKPETLKTEALTLIDKNLGIGPRRIYGGKLRLSKTAKCIRNVSNWSTVKLKYRFDNHQFDPILVRKVMAEASPKINQMIHNIKLLDENDFKETGKTFKHFIYSDIRGTNGIKIVASAMISSGYKLGMIPKNQNIELELTEPNQFVLLTGTALWGYPIKEETKKEIIKIFNERPKNIYGDKIRFIIGDSGYKEGVDLFDVKYIHILEPQLSDADTKQIIGRATRLCGQSGLKFIPNQGWKLDVYEYHLRLPNNKKEVNTAHDLMLKVGKVDVSQTQTINELQNLMFQTAVDRDLNLAINFYGKEETTFDKFQKEFQEITGRKPASLPKLKKKKYKI